MNICCKRREVNGFKDIYFVASKRSEKQGKTKHFETNNISSICFQNENDSLTLVGEVDIITSREKQEELWNESDRKFFPKGLDDPKIRFIHFHTLEATFWINHKFRTVQYK